MLVYRQTDRHMLITILRTLPGRSMTVTDDID